MRVAADTPRIGCSHYSDINDDLIHGERDEARRGTSAEGPVLFSNQGTAGTLVPP